MILRNCLLLFLYINFGLSTTSPRGRTEPTISECAAKGGECDETKGRPVCGTDKQTYPTRCHLIRAQCSGHQVSLKHRGSCKECIETRTYALSHRSASPSKFVPRCRVDGSYAPVQCMEGAGCWCSDSTGKPIHNTTTRTGKPNCRKNSKSNIRRSPPRNISNNKNKRGCTQVDQALFNTNLIKVFQSEYNRYQNQHSHNNAGTISDKTVLDWKFMMLDTNGNHLLDKNEYRELKRLVKKVIKPKRCARAFGRYCDIDLDERLSRLEWSNCLSRDGMNRGPSFTGGNNGGGDGSLSTTNRVHFNHALPVEDVDDEDDDGSDQRLDEYDDSDDYEDEASDSENRFNSFGGISSSQSNTPVTPYPPVYLLRHKTIVESDPVLRESEGESDCLADRNAALDEQKSGAQAMYVPECTADGRYHRVQCYRSTGYCWCVHEDTGKNIPGTSVKDQRPQCDSIYPNSRPMKGCPEPKKTEFLRDLKDFLKVQVAASANTGANATKWNTEDEKIATLSFVLLDKNKNKVWERKEWKTFRELVTASKPLRKCGKKMPRYCDVNSDKKITLSEWLNCLQAQRVPIEVPKIINESKTGIQSKLRGPNPLESYLKSD